MAVGLGWKQVAPQFPYVNGELWSNGVTRKGNNISFSFNLKLVVPTYHSWWNYAWYVNVKCGDVEVVDKLVKSRMNRNDIITGQEFWYSTNNGNFDGSIDIGGQDSTIPVTVTFHDSAGNWGQPQTWNVQIPTASSMSAIKSSITSLNDDSATIQSSIDDMGNYATITQWQLNYGQNSLNENEQSISKNTSSVTWSLDNLQSGTYYNYKIQVLNSAGFTQNYTGNFYTQDSTIGNLVVSGQPTKILTGYIIRPDGQIQKIKEIRRVQ